MAAASVVRYGVFAGLIFFCLRTETTLVWIGVFECISLLASSALCVWVARSDLRATIARVASAASRPARASAAARGRSA